MPLVFEGPQVRFEDVCTVEDALPFIEHLRTSGAAEIDLADCVYLHTALLQLLLIVRPTILAMPTDPFLARWITPLLEKTDG